MIYSMKSDKLIAAFLIGIAVLLLLEMALHPLTAKADADPCASGCTVEQRAHLDFVNGTSATTTPATTTPAIATGASVVKAAYPVATIAASDDEQQIRLLMQEIALLEQLIALLKK